MPVSEVSLRSNLRSLILYREKCSNTVSCNPRYVRHFESVDERASAIAATCYRGTMKAIYGAIAARCCNTMEVLIWGAVGYDLAQTCAISRLR